MKGRLAHPIPSHPIPSHPILPYSIVSFPFFPPLFPLFSPSFPLHSGHLFPSKPQSLTSPLSPTPFTLSVTFLSLSVLLLLSIHPSVTFNHRQNHYLYAVGYLLYFYREKKIEDCHSLYTLCCKNVIVKIYEVD